MPVVPASLDAVHIGARVVVRWRLEPVRDRGRTTAPADDRRPRRAGGPPRRDVSRGDPTRAASSIAARPRRRRPRRSRPGRAAAAPAHLALSIADLARVMAPSWGALEREPLGDWELRASGGFTQRATRPSPSATPASRSPRPSTGSRRWYAVRGLPPAWPFAGPTGFDPADGPARRRAPRAGLDARRPHPHPHRADRDHRRRRSRRRRACRSTEDLDDAVARGLPPSRSVVRRAWRAVLHGSPRQLFARRVRREAGRARHRLTQPPVGASAGSRVAHGWAGLRRRPDRPGLPRDADWRRAPHGRLAARRRRGGIRLCTCRSRRTTPRRSRLYERLGFERHSSYVYLTGPRAPLTRVTSASGCVQVTSSSGL